MASFRVRPLTILLVILAVVLVAIALVYLTKSAASLPSFFPGHDPHSTKHHVKHGIFLIALALVALGGAWFTTAPERVSSD